MIDILIQAIGIIAMAFNILSYQFKTAKQIILVSFIAAILFCINMYMLGAYTGAMINLFAVIRGIYLCKVSKPKKWTFFIFLFLILAIYSITFLVFKKEPTFKNFLVELLPTVAVIVQTFAYYKDNPDKIRYYSYFISPCWLIYNIINFTIGGILCESFALVSITISLIRSHHSKPNNSVNELD